jgi:hypothetical protein
LARSELQSLKEIIIINEERSMNNTQNAFENRGRKAKTPEEEPGSETAQTV